MDENTLKFKYGTTDYDANLIAEYLHDNAQGWLQSLGLTGKKGEAALASINDLIGRILSGDIDNVQFDGVVNSKSGTFNDNSKDKKFLGIKVGHDIGSNNIAAEFLNLGLAQLKGSNLSSTSESTKEKFGDKDRIHQAWINKYFGGRDPGDDLELVWSNRDVANEEGIRARTNRLNEFAGVLDSLYNDSSLNDLDYNGSAFTNADAYREALRNASNAARSGNYDEFLRAYAAAGGNTGAANIMFSDKLLSSTALTKEPTKIESELNDYKKELESSGAYSAETINKMVEAKRQQLLKSYKLEELSALEDEDWNNYYNGLDSTYNGKSYTFGAWTDADADKWYGWHGKLAPLDETERKEAEAKGLIGNGQAAALFDNAWNSFIKGESLSESLQEALRAKLHYDDLNDSKTYEKVAPNTYLIKATEKNGTAWVWNDKTKQLSLISAQHGSSFMKNRLKKSWQKKRYAEYAKNGAKLEQLRVLKALSGAEIVQRQKARGTAAYNAGIEAEAKATGKTADQVKVGHADALSTKSHLASDGIQGGLNNSDITRLITAGVDLASIPVSYVPVGGNAIAGVMGLGTTIADLWADATDDSVSSGQMWSNLGMNAGLTGLSLVGGGLAKGSKVAKTIVKLLPSALAAYGASEMLNDKNFLKSFTKLKNGDFKHFTTNDVKNISAAIKLIASGHNATKSAAGSIGVDMATAKPKYFNNTINKTGKGLASWGNNASFVSKYAAKANDKLPILKDLKMTDRYNIAKLLNDLLINKGGFRSGEVIPLLESNGKVKIGGQEVNKETAIAMQDAFKKASSKPGATVDSVKSEIMKAYQNSAEGKAGHIPAKAEQLAAEFVGDATSIGNQFNVAADANGKFNINGQLLDATLKLKYLDLYNNTAGDHTAKLNALNNSWKNDFKIPGAPEKWALNESDFDFSGLKSNKGWWDIRRFGGRGELSSVDENPGFIARQWNKISPNRTDMFDLSTRTGRYNARLLNLLQQLRGDRVFASDVEYNNGLAGAFGLTGRDAAKDVKKMEDFRLNKLDLKHKITLTQALERIKQRKLNNKPNADKINQLKFEAEIRKTPELASLTSDLAKTMINLYKTKSGFNGTDIEALKQIKQEASTSGRSIKSILRNPSPKSNSVSTNTPRVLGTYGSKIHTTRTTNGTTATKLNTYSVHNSGKHPLSPDALSLLRAEGINPSSNTNKVGIVPANKDYVYKMLGLLPNQNVHAIYKSPNTGRYYWWKQGGKVNQLKVLRQGGSILKFLPGGNMYPSDFKIPTMDDNNSWYWNRWAQHELGGRNANATVGNSTPLAGADHNKDFTLGMAYAKNDAYTGLSNLVRNDLLNYIDKGGDDYSDLASLVNGYNKHIGTLNNFWLNKEYTANVASDATAAHNDLFRRLYASRSDNSANNNALIGWQEDGVAGKRYMGTSTWMRRADLYADKFADLKNDNDIRNRLHQVTLKNGTKGYVYKEADGTIGIADDALLQRLGLGTSNNPQTPLNPDLDPQVLQNQNRAHRVDLTLVQSDLKNLKLGTLVKDLPWNKIANYIDTNQVNKEMLDLANKETTALLRHTPITDNVRNGFSLELFANRMADNIKRAGATAARNTADAATAMSILMDANAKADETRQQGKVASDQITEQSKLNVTKYRDNNIAQADADFNENNAKLAALYNSILTNKAGKLVQDNANRVQFRNDIKAWMDTKEQNQRQFKAKAMSQLVQYLMDNIQRKYKLQYQNASEADKPKIIAAMQKEQAELLSKVMPIYYNNLAKINGINDFDFNLNNPFEEMKTWTWRLPTNKKEGGKLEQLASLKKGGSTHRTSDDGPRRTRAKDLDRHEKNRKNYADLVEKKKERLARLKGKYVDRYLK